MQYIKTRRASQARLHDTVRGNNQQSHASHQQTPQLGFGYNGKLKIKKKWNSYLAPPIKTVLRPRLRKKQAESAPRFLSTFGSYRRNFRKSKIFCSKELVLIPHNNHGDVVLGNLNSGWKVINNVKITFLGGRHWSWRSWKEGGRGEAHCETREKRTKKVGKWTEIKNRWTSPSDCCAVLQASKIS